TPLFLLLIPPPPQSTLFPYTTLFRSPFSLNTLPLPEPTGSAPHVRDASRDRYARPREAIDAAITARHRGDDHLGPISRKRRTPRSEEHTSELQSQSNLVCRLLLEKNK